MALKRVTDTQPSLRFSLINKQEGMGACDEASGASPGATAPSADLGGSRAWDNQQGKEILLSLTPVRLCELTWEV